MGYSINPFSDYVDLGSNHYLLVGDRLSGWVEVFSAQSSTKNAGAHSLIAFLRSFFAIFSIPETLSTDGGGGGEFVASGTSEFLNLWGVQHRVSSAYHPQSNGRAEVAVKKIKRLLLSCIGPSGSLNNDKFLLGCCSCETRLIRTVICPLHILSLAGAFEMHSHSSISKLSLITPSIHPVRRTAWKAKEDLPKLNPGERVFIQK